MGSCSSSSSTNDGHQHLPTATLNNNNNSTSKQALNTAVAFTDLIINHPVKLSSPNRKNKTTTKNQKVLSESHSTRDCVYDKSKEPFFLASNSQPNGIPCYMVVNEDKSMNNNNNNNNRFDNGIKDTIQESSHVVDGSTAAGSSLSDFQLGIGRSSATRTSTLSVRSITEEVRGSLTRNGSLQELLVPLHEEETNIRSYYTGVDSDSRTSIIGKGNWGTVKVVTRKRDNQKFACKELTLSERMSHSQFEELKSEIESLSRLDHPHIARLYEAFEEPGRKLYIVMEFLTGGELYTRLVEEAPGGRFTERRAKILTSKISSALSYLHGQGIVHRDLKLENFVFRDRDPESDKIVLIDFGLAKRFSIGQSVRIMNNYRNSTTDDPTAVDDPTPDPTIIMSSVVGSSYYIAPEVLDGHYSGPLCDIWSMGVIVYMMLCGKAPFNGKSETSIMKKAQIGEYPMSGSIWDSVSKEAKDFVSKCLTKNVAKRMTASDALNHPWVLSLNKESRRKGEYILPRPVIQNLVSFSDLPDFARIACQAAAFSFSRTEISEFTEMFELLDSNGDGYITEKDINQALKLNLDAIYSMFPDIKNERDKDRFLDALSKKIFAGMDTEHFGLVRFTYFVSAVVQPEKYYRDVVILREAFHKLDFGRKGYIDYTDLMKLHFTCQKARDIIHNFLTFETDVERTKSNHPQSPDATSRGSSDVEHICIEFRDFLIAMRALHTKDDDIANDPNRRSSPKQRISLRKQIPIA